MNIAEILKNCPQGLKLYSPIFGYVKFSKVDGKKSIFPITVTACEAINETYTFTKEGKFEEIEDAMCLLFPSKEILNWDSPEFKEWYEKNCIPEKEKLPITERVKTFEDACKVLGKNHHAVKLYETITQGMSGISDLETDTYVIAYLKLCIITAALNEGWEPTFEGDERRWYAWYFVKNGGVSSVNAGFDSSYSYAHIGSRLVFKTEELAEYAGKQFIEIYQNFIMPKRSDKETVGDKTEEKSEYVDLGLPSGTLWKDSNEENFHTYGEAKEKFGKNLPTKEQWDELKNCCMWSREENGRKVTGPNGNSIFLPAAGYIHCGFTEVYDEGTCGYYLSSTSMDSVRIWNIFFGISKVVHMDCSNRCHAFSVRLVK